jgi:peptide/nickel transport system substrate-binding protein
VDPSFLLSIVTCGTRGALNDTGYCNPEFEKLYDKQATITDPEQRLQAVYEAQRFIYREKPYLAVFYPKAIYAYNKSWKGFTPVVGGQPLNLYTTSFLENVYN